MIDVQVALGLDRDVDARVPRQQIEHMIEEADAGFDRRATLSVEIDFDFAVGLRRLAWSSLSPALCAFERPANPLFARLLSGVAGIRHLGWRVNLNLPKT